VAAPVAPGTDERVAGDVTGVVAQRDGTMIDYAALLKKYIAYIADCEGIDYIEPIDLRDSSDVNFTDAEWQALQTIHDEQAQGVAAPTEVTEVWALPDDVSQPPHGHAKDDYPDG
jgi:hypothetical protein